MNLRGKNAIWSLSITSMKIGYNLIWRTFVKILEDAFSKVISRQLLKFSLFLALNNMVISLLFTPLGKPPSLTVASIIQKVVKYVN